MSSDNFERRSSFDAKRDQWNNIRDSRKNHVHVNISGHFLQIKIYLEQKEMISFVLGQVMCWRTTAINENNLFRSVDRTNMAILVNGDTVIQTNTFSVEKVN